VISGISGNRALDPQVAHTFEAALGSSLFSSRWNVRLNILVNGFFNLVHGKVEYIQSGNFIRADNSSDLRTAGIESSLKFAYRRAVTGHVNYSWQKTAVSKCLLADPTLCRKNSELNYLYPTHLLGFGAAYRSRLLRLRLSLYGYLVGERWASQSNRAENIPSASGAGFDYKAYSLPSYVVLNCAVSTFDLKLFAGRETVFSVALYNLLNTGIVEPGFNGIDTPGLGLTLMGSLQQRF
jgi:hypothetical protein